MSNLTTAQQYFVSHGWTPVQAAAIAGNLQYESGLNPAEDQGDGGHAYGIAEWHAPRQTLFQTIFGKSIRGSSLQDQLGYVNYELTQGAYAGVGNQLRQTNDINAATRLVMQGYEAPAISSQVNSINDRIAQANLALTGGGGGGNPIVDGSQVDPESSWSLYLFGQHIAGDTLTQQQIDQHNANMNPLNPAYGANGMAALTSIFTTNFIPIIIAGIGIFVIIFAVFQAVRAPNSNIFSGFKHANA